MRQFVTGPVEEWTVLYRAIEFANVPAWRLQEGVPKRLRVLPPGAPYKMDQRGNVYASPRRRRDDSLRVKQCWDAMRQALGNATRRGRPGDEMDVHVKLIKEEGHQRYPDGSGYEMKEEKLLHIHMPFETAFWWRRQMIDKGRLLDAEYVLPTLDGLVAAARGVLLSRKARGRIRQCPSCQRYFVRGPRRQATCGRETCKSERIRMLGAARARRHRGK